MSLRAIAIALLASLTLDAQAGSLRVIARNSSVVLERAALAWTPGANVGDITLDLFTREANAGRLQFRGSREGMVEIAGEGNAIERISETEMKAYGWCFSVDGIAPDTMADQTILTGDDESIVWFYAYGHYRDGRWISMCRRDSPEISSSH